MIAKLTESVIIPKPNSTELKDLIRRYDISPTFSRYRGKNLPDRKPGTWFIKELKDAKVLCFSYADSHNSSIYISAWALFSAFESSRLVIEVPFLTDPSCKLFGEELEKAKAVNSACVRKFMRRLVRVESEDELISVMNDYSQRSLRSRNWI